MSDSAATVLAILLGFGIGSVPPAVLIGRLWGVDVLHEGSRNPGVSNVELLAGRTAAVLTFLSDLAIGLFVVAVPLWAAGAQGVAVAAALGTMAGRAWSPWLGGSGGRGQMLIIGMGLGLVPWVAAVYLAVYAFFAVVKGMGLGGLVNLIVLVPATALLYPFEWAMTFAIGVAVIGILRRLQGSPDGGGHSLAQRLLHDREREPDASVGSAEPSSAGA